MDRHGVNPLAYLLALACLLGLAVDVAAQEPTEGEMRGVLERQMATLSDEQRARREACERRVFERGQGDPEFTAQCKGPMAGPQAAAVRDFHKLACRKAEGQPGYECRYTVTVGLSGGALPAGMVEMTSRAQQCTGRFVRDTAGWVLASRECEGG